MLQRYLQAAGTVRIMPIVLRLSIYYPTSSKCPGPIRCVKDISDRQRGSVRFNEARKILPYFLPSSIASPSNLFLIPLVSNYLL